MRAVRAVHSVWLSGLAGLAGLVGCWSSSQPAREPAPPVVEITPAPEVEPAPVQLDDYVEYGGAVYGGAAGASAPAPAGALSATQGPPASFGASDKYAIRDVIRKHIAEISACYERELPADPSLAGRVFIAFTINADGSVSDARGSGMPGVDGCVAAAISRLVFPPPAGGGQVNVSYPFNFGSAGQASAAP